MELRKNKLLYYLIIKLLFFVTITNISFGEECDDRIFTYSFSTIDKDCNEYLMLQLGYDDPDYQEDYLIKMLNLNNAKIEWLKKKDIKYRRTGDPIEFLDTVFKHQLSFYATGEDPNWYAKISEKKLELVFNQEESLKKNIVFDITPTPGRLFHPSFISNDKELFYLFYYFLIAHQV